MEDDDLDALCIRVSTWDQAELDRLLGPPAVAYAEKQERDVRHLADMMWAVFPLGPRWWKIRRALIACRRKAKAIRVRSAQIAADRATGKIIQVGGRLVYRDQL